MLRHCQIQPRVAALARLAALPGPKEKVSFVSTSHGLENVSQVCSCSGRRSNIVPALKTSRFGLVCERIRFASSSIASATTIVAEVSCARSSRRFRFRATAVTVIPLATKLSTMPRPNPRLAPTTRAVCPLKFISSSCELVNSSSIEELLSPANTAGGGARIRGAQFGASFELLIPQGFASLRRNGSFRNRRTTRLTRREKTMGR